MVKFSNPKLYSFQYCGRSCGVVERWTSRYYGRRRCGCLRSVRRSGACGTGPTGFCGRCGDLRWTRIVSFKWILDRFVPGDPVGGVGGSDLLPAGRRRFRRLVSTKIDAGSRSNAEYERFGGPQRQSRAVAARRSTSGDRMTNTVVGYSSCSAQGGSRPQMGGEVGGADEWCAVSETVVWYRRTGFKCSTKR